MSRLLSGWGIRILIVAVLVGGAFVFRDRLSSNAADLAVGDCFDVPTGQQEIKDVQHHPCNEPHNAEVFAIPKHPAEKDAAYPSSDDIDEFFLSSCVPAFETYTGSKAAEQTALDAGYFYPLKTGWDSGDRDVICYLVPLPDGSTTSKSYKDAKP